jgi:sugar O-acyltransferase (sialic acid O-acetyltransferase NeuD family)
MKVVFLGAANPETGRMIRALERAQPNFQAHGFIDSAPEKKGTNFLGLPVFGGFEVLDKLIADDVHFVNLITGSTTERYETSLQMAHKGCKFANFVHPGIDLTMTEIGVGNYLQESVVIQADVRIGHNSSIHIGTMVGHESTIGNSVFIAHACSISGNVRIEDGVFIGTNATIVPRLRIGKWATVGAGAVAVKDVPDYAVVVGNPAKVIKMNERVYEHGNIFAEGRS